MGRDRDARHAQQRQEGGVGRVEDEGRVRAVRDEVGDRDGRVAQRLERAAAERARGDDLHAEVLADDVLGVPRPRVDAHAVPARREARADLLDRRLEAAVPCRDAARAHHRDAQRRRHRHSRPAALCLPARLVARGAREARFAEPHPGDFRRRDGAEGPRRAGPSGSGVVLALCGEQPLGEQHLDGVGRVVEEEGQLLRLGALEVLEHVVGGVHAAGGRPTPPRTRT